MDQEVKAGNRVACEGAKRVSLPVISQSDADNRGGKVRKSKNARRRAIVLGLVHVVFALHLTQWLIMGRTVSPVEPSESMQTLELGLVNAGFIFFAVALLSTLIFGRFFCGWGCHVVALQDLCGWMMKKLGVRPKPFRSRLLLIFPLALALYMFVWPTFKRLALIPAMERWTPQWASIFTVAPFPEDGFTSHLIVEDFWATFASVGVAIPFLLVCGFATVYFLGAKGFCTYGCPYGGFFAPLDKVSFGKIVVDHDKCHQCGHCTAVCTSNVRVHDEIREYGKVVDPGCMKCMDCVSVCPNGALSFSFSGPSVAKGKPKNRAPKRVYDASLGEEIALAIMALVIFFALRGAYGVVPMLFAVGISACATFLVWKLWRVLRTPNVRLLTFQLRLRGKMTRAGLVWSLATLLMLAVITHTGFVNYHRWRGDRHFARVNVPLERLLSEGGAPPNEQQREAARSALRHYGVAASWRDGGVGLAGTPVSEMNAAHAHLVVGEIEKTERLLSKLVYGRGPSDRLAADLGRILLLQGKVEEAARHYARWVERNPTAWETLQELCMLAFQRQRPQDGIIACREALAKLGNRPKERIARGRAELNLARMHEASGEPDKALEAYRRSVDAAPREAVLRENLSSALARLAGDLDGALRELDAAESLRPSDGTPWFFFGQVQLRAGNINAAIESFERAYELMDRHPAQRAEMCRYVAQFMEALKRPSEQSKWIERASEAERAAGASGPQ